MIKTKEELQKPLNDQLTIGSRVIRMGFKALDGAGFDLSKYGPFHITSSREKRFVWFRVPKSGTTNLIFALKKSNIKLDAEYTHDCYYLPAFYADYFKFSFVRNPWSRIVSAWKNKVIDNPGFSWGVSGQVREQMRDFEYFVKEFVSNQDLSRCDGHIRLQTKLMPVEDMDFIGQLENYQSDIEYIKSRLQLDDLNIKKADPGNKRPKYPDYYNNELKNLIGDLYASDISCFNYEF